MALQCKLGNLHSEGLEIRLLMATSCLDLPKKQSEDFRKTKANRTRSTVNGSPRNKLSRLAGCLCLGPLLRLITFFFASRKGARERSVINCKER